jgi:hypothetical protein
MRVVRLHASIFDEPPSDKQSTVAFIEIDTLIPDDQTLSDYLGGLTVRCYVTDDDAETRATADLTPTLIQPVA